jgi:hypothetical protein
MLTNLEVQIPEQTPPIFVIHNVAVRIHSEVGDEDKRAPDRVLGIDVTLAGDGVHSTIVTLRVLLAGYQVNGFEDGNGALEVDLHFDEEPDDLEAR